MKNKFFIHPEISKRLLALLLISFLVSFKFFLAFLMFVALLYFLFRKTHIDEGKLRSSDNSILLAPISGNSSVKVSGGKARVTIKVGFFKGFGVSMPFDGEVNSYFETNESLTLLKFLPVRRTKIILVLKSKLFGETKFILMRTGFIFRPRIWVRSGDKGLVGAYLGFLPFGGKIVIEMKDTVKILTKNNNKAVALATLIASNRN